MPKHAFQLWQAAQSRLLMRDMLCRLNILVPNKNCVAETESHQHVLFCCNLSKQVLKALFQWLGFEGWSNNFAS
ncbi:hypothetical protein G4B88_023395 [Cannabis sativa]|uniref:Reverse transcriptase zinc-binding domain-containing protein n=1 Tax=Cannabis sativa TaxID=3483 RepID=A0A7J6HZ64_CANSA|nr:hypothetical protein G4B88_023395 [Cannabis sativa]